MSNSIKYFIAFVAFGVLFYLAAVVHAYSLIDWSIPGRNDTKGLRLSVMVGWIPAFLLSAILITCTWLATRIVRVLSKESKGVK